MNWKRIICAVRGHRAVAEVKPVEGLKENDLPFMKRKIKFFNPASLATTTSIPLSATMTFNAPHTARKCEVHFCSRCHGLFTQAGVDQDYLGTFRIFPL